MTFRDFCGLLLVFWGLLRSFVVFRGLWSNYTGPELNAPEHVVNGEQKAAVGRVLSSRDQQRELDRKYSHYFRQRLIDTRRVVDDVGSRAVT